MKLWPVINAYAKTAQSAPLEEFSLPKSFAFTDVLALGGIRATRTEPR